LRGIFAIIFGIAAVFFPETAFLSLVLIFGAYALVDGIFSLISVFVSSAHQESWWWLVLEGIFGILIGVLTLFQPVAMGVAWITVIAVLGHRYGSSRDNHTAIRLLAQMIEGEFWMILSGLFSVLFGIPRHFFTRKSGVFAIGLIVGIYALIFGIFLVNVCLASEKT
jgi:uncharacterized membrane protein HdeD (DUF308 family)